MYTAVIPVSLAYRVKVDDPEAAIYVGDMLLDLMRSVLTDEDGPQDAEGFNDLNDELDALVEGGVLAWKVSNEAWDVVERRLTARRRASNIQAGGKKPGVKI